MRQGHIIIVLLLIVIATNASIFSFLKSSGSEAFEESVDTNPIRGAPQYLHDKYMADPFLCGDGTKLPVSAVNDGYCDCADGSDEPGTSACLGSTFHCVNPGYKIVQISSSRVDDQVCDCCDGSDEGRVVKCPNTCKAVAQQEMAKLTKMTNDYKIGSRIREQLIDSVKKEKAAAVAQLPTLREDVDKLTEEVNLLTGKLKDTGDRMQLVEERVAAEEKAVIKTILKLEAFTLGDLALFISNLFKVHEVSSNTIRRLVNKRSVGGEVSASTNKAMPAAELKRKRAEAHKAAAKAAVTSGELHKDEDFTEVPDPQNDDDDGDDAPRLDEDEEGPACKLVELAKDDYALLPLCDTVDTVEASIEFIAELMQDQQPDCFDEVLLLLGFYHVHHSFEGSGEFVKQHKESDARDACPAEFTALQNGEHICGMEDRLLSDLGIVDDQYGLEELRAERDKLKDEKTAKDNQKRDAVARLDNAVAADKELQQYGDNLPLLAMKDECFDVTDGNYRYTTCIMGKVTQKEISGSSTVTLGKFKSMESSDYSGDSVVMNFDHGQHCHAFGARKATVHIVCGARNELLSASEPSTCAYELLLESPAACSAKFAQLNGISV